MSSNPAPVSEKFGTFLGVYTPSILTILGLIMYLRFGWVLGNVGLGLTLLIVVPDAKCDFLLLWSRRSNFNILARTAGIFHTVSGIPIAPPGSKPRLRDTRKYSPPTTDLNISGNCTRTEAGIVIVTALFR
jgi:hypothetical protein